jgi:hypothetical protein
MVALVIAVREASETSEPSRGPPQRPVLSPRL